MKVPGGVQSWLWLSSIVLMTTVPAVAANFSELLARAKAEAAAGRNWGPPGDNVADTVMAMMDLTPSATPEQLAEVLALLKTDKVVPKTDKTGAASVDASIDPTSPAIREPHPAVPDQTPAPAMPPIVNSPPETPPPAKGVVLESPKAQPPIGNSGAGDPSVAGTVRTTPPGPHAVALSQRGHEAELSGDISGARRFFASAAELGDASAALSLGRLYDPAFVERNAVGGIDSDPAQARHWYKLAAALGDAEARPLLEALSVR